jgi:hypothetical protein
MLKFHEAEDIFALKLRKPDGQTDADISATIPSGYVEVGMTVRLIAPSNGVDSRVKVLRAEREVDVTGNLSTIEGKFVR